MCAAKCTYPPKSKYTRRDISKTKMPRRKQIDCVYVFERISFFNVVERKRPHKSKNKQTKCVLKTLLWFSLSLFRIGVLHKMCDRKIIIIILARPRNWGHNEFFSFVWCCCFVKAIRICTNTRLKSNVQTSRWSTLKLRFS